MRLTVRNCRKRPAGTANATTTVQQTVSTQKKWAQQKLRTHRKDGLFASVSRWFAEADPTVGRSTSRANKKTPAMRAEIGQRHRESNHSSKPTPKERQAQSELAELAELARRCVASTQDHCRADMACHVPANHRGFRAFPLEIATHPLRDAPSNRRNPPRNDYPSSSQTTPTPTA